jgi:hypothetical protein
MDACSWSNWPSCAHVPGTLCHSTLRSACEGESLHTLSSIATPCQHTHTGKWLQLLVAALSCNT